MKRNLFPISVLLLSLIFLCTSCEELVIPESIFDSDSSVQIPDVTNLTATITGNSPAFSWEGNDYALEFSFKLELDKSDESELLGDQLYFNWSEWNTETSVVFYDLDEGQYTFYVKSKFDITEELEPASHSFQIDNITKPALRIFPLHQTANTGDEIDVYLYLEEVPQQLAVAGMHVDIIVDSTKLRFIEAAYQKGELLTQFGGDTVWPEPTFNVNSNKMSIYGVAYEDGSGLFGTGAIAKFRLRVLSNSGTSSINIDSDGISILDIDDNTILFETYNGKVTIEGTGL